METIPWWWRDLPPEAVARSVTALENCQMTSGTLVSELEESLAETLGYPSVVVVNSGTTALIASLLLAGVGPGDNVIVPALTWIATAQAARLLGAEVRVADVMADSLFMNLDHVAALADSRTRAVVPVLFNGRSRGLQEVHTWARRQGVFVVEDRCKALGTTSLGVQSLFPDSTAAFSMGMISHISIGYGGFIGCSSESQASQLRLIRDHGIVRSNERYERLGGNFKVSDFVAALAIPQVPQLVGSVSLQISVEKVYEDALLSLASGLTHFGVNSTCDTDAGTYHEGILDDDIPFPQFAAACLKHGVEVQSYHPSITEANYLESSDAKVAESIARRLVLLPSGNSVTESAAMEAASRISRAMSEVLLP